MPGALPGPLRHFAAQLDELRCADVLDMNEVGRLYVELAADEEFFGPLIAEIPADTPGDRWLMRPERGPRLVLVHRPDGVMGYTHSHRCWVGIAPIRGVETHQRWDAVRLADGRAELRLADERALVGGDVATLVPPRQCPGLAAGRCQERVTMMAEPPENQVTEAAGSLEVRWIFPGQLEAAVAGWFARFPARTESREDAYLLDPRLRGLSVKVRGGGVLDVKVYGGSPGILEVAGRARGRMESWQKWSFPFSPLGPGSGEAAGWRPVRKRRRISRFSLASGQLEARGPGLGEQPRCEVELTEVQARGQDWWTLGFEATGPADLLPSELQATAALVFAQALPADMKPGPQDSRSYAEWLGQRPGTDSDADT